MIPIRTQKLTPHRPLDVASIVIHGDDGIEPVADVAPPLHPTSTFAAADAAEFAGDGDRCPPSALLHPLRQPDPPAGRSDRWPRSKAPSRRC